jgi:K+-sensing histidine kinase KdpD/AmiR/NasT family two-component response regulator
MESNNWHVLLIESNAEICQLIAEQALQPLGYTVDVYGSASTAIQEVEKIAPDVIITNLNLVGLSGKDLLVALKAGGINIPIIVIANKGQEADILQAFRLGADDYLIAPFRETEVISVVENTLHKQQTRIDLDVCSHKLDQTKVAMERQLHDFLEIFSIFNFLRPGVKSQSLYEKIADVVIKLAEADSVWILAADAKQSQYILQAFQNAPKEMQSKLYLPYEDGLSALVAASGRIISIHGEAIKRFTNSESIESALVVPVKQADNVSAIITVTRNTPQPFSATQQAMLELVGEYTSIVLENSERIRLLEKRLVFLQQSNIYAMIESDLKYDLLLQASLELRSPLKYLTENVDFILNKTDHKLTHEQEITIKDILEEAETLMDIADSMVRIRQGETSRVIDDVDLNEVIRSAVNHYQPIAQLAQITITLELPSKPTIIKVYASQITKVIEGLLSNALKYSPPHGQITIHIDQMDYYNIVMVKNQGELIDEHLAEKMFEKKSNILGYTPRRYGGLGISLAMIKEIVSAYKGNICFENRQDGGFTITFNLPRI